MRSYAYGYTVACLLAFLEKVLTRAAVVNGTIPVAAQQVVTYEEYVVEHDISTEQARNAALAIDLNSSKSIQYKMCNVYLTPDLLQGLLC